MENTVLSLKGRLWLLQKCSIIFKGVALALWKPVLPLKERPLLYHKHSITFIGAAMASWKTQCVAQSPHMLQRGWAGFLLCHQTEEVSFTGAVTRK